MGRASFRLPDLSGAGQTIGHRHSFSAGQTQPAGEAATRALQAGTKLAGWTRLTRTRPPVAPSIAADHAERQRERSSRPHSAASTQAVKDKYRSRQDRLFARAILRAMR